MVGSTGDSVGSTGDGVGLTDSKMGSTGVWTGDDSTGIVVGSVIGANDVGLIIGLALVVGLEPVGSLTGATVGTLIGIIVGGMDCMDSSTPSARAP